MTKIAKAAAPASKAVTNPFAKVAMSVDQKANGKLVSAQIKGVAASTKELGDRIRIMTASVVVHAILHRDVSRADHSIEAIGGSLAGKSSAFIRTNELRRWYTEVGPFRWSSSEKRFKLNTDTIDKIKANYEADPEAFVEGLLAMPYWEVHKEAEFKPVLAGTELQRFANKLAKTAEDEDRDHSRDFIPAALLHEVQNLAAKIYAAEVAWKADRASSPVREGTAKAA